MPTPKGPAEPVEIELEDEDDERTVAAPADFVPGHKPPPPKPDAGAISLDDDDDDRTTIEKRPGPQR